ncbi:hypothetical protein ACN42_g386 [Penicillium freii]|uniref:chitinase n=1 Tax=Penicillium freii TaxID=48697 RepID=A0A117NSS5_PENFR|nr:hypothetical protein ACN42_g386 [Penicillium freii]
MKTALQALIPFSSFSSLITLPYLVHAAPHTVTLAPVAPIGEFRTEDPIASPLINGCPRSCTLVGPDPGNWTWITRQNDLIKCDQPLLFDFQVGNEPSSHAVVRSCALSEALLKRSLSPYVNHASWAHVDTSDLDAVDEALTVSNSCGASQQTTTVSVQLGAAGAVKFSDDAKSAVNNLASYMTNAASCGSTILLAKVGDAVAALYAGADVYQSSVGSFLEQFVENFEKGSQTLQVCNSESMQDETIGIHIIESLDQLEVSHEVLQAWSRGNCLSIDAQNSVQAKMATLGVPRNDKRSSISSYFENALTPRGDCRTIIVGNGDSCGALASRCGISANDFNKYNSASNLCSTLKRKQRVCCSAGSLPDIRPKPQSDGTCATYAIQGNDNCGDIAAQFGITKDDINNYNKETWAWAGCGQLQPNQVICLSKGNTPMPASLTNAVCGPQKPGTKAPAGSYNGWNLTTLNPCPLNACCSGWGFCGTTEEFCTKSPADTKAPGAFQKGKSGCISNCGTSVVNNDKPPDSFHHVAYFEAFNMKRDCLNMDVKEINHDKLTHVHFAFAGLSEDFDITFDDSYSDQFDAFVEMDAPWKKVLSFGGWAESTNSDTFQRYRDVVKPENRDKFAKNILAFFDKHNLDGIDFDWEYPGATDIPGVPAGTSGETSDYLEFLKLMKKTIGDRSLSIALPASYWYLKAFPIAKMAPYLSYFIYMTYDLHGQWDHGNAYADVACPAGNCLRSHVNKTETLNSLALITKADVPASKVVVGISSYGRSFGMTDPSCTGPMCTYTGTFNHSTAEVGTCTNTAGYIANAELNQIIEGATAGITRYQARSWHDDESDSDMMVYGTSGKITSWVAYMNDTTKSNRIDWVKDLNFGGVSDWAIDLEDWNTGIDPDSQDAVDLDVSLPKGCPSDNWPDTLDELKAKLDDIDTECQAQAVVYILLKIVSPAVSDYQEASKNFDEYFGYYKEWVRNGIDDSLSKFMWSDGRKYMDCTWSSKDSSGSGACTDMLVKQGQPGQGIVTVTYKMRDEDGFYKALMKDYGIDKNWIHWVDIGSETQPCRCPDLKHNCPACRREPDTNVYKNYPRKIDDNSKIKITNPKSVIDAAIPNITELSTTMLGIYTQMRLMIFDAPDGDVATAFSMPVFMLGEATTQIKQIKKIGEEQKDADAKAKVSFILDIVNIVLMVIPFAGEAAEAIGGVTNIARGATMIGEAGNAAIVVADIVNDPTSAPFAILALLLGGSAGVVGKGTKKAFSEAAAARKAMSAETLKSFSATFRKNDEIVQNIVKACRG